MRYLSTIGRPNAMKRPMNSLASVGSISAQARTQMAATAYTGTRSARATLLQSWWPGTARSRENANSMRDADVTDALPQNNWPTQAMNRRPSAQVELIEFSQMYTVAKPTASRVPWT